MALVSTWGLVFDRSAGPSAARAEGIEPSVKAVHLGRIVAIRCEISPLMGIVGKIVQFPLSGHVLDVRAVLGS
jgi:hypothetical protein